MGGSVVGKKKEGGGEVDTPMHTMPNNWLTYSGGIGRPGELCYNYSILYNFN